MAIKPKQKKLISSDQEMEILERSIPDGTHLYTQKELKEIDEAFKEADTDIAAGRMTILKSDEDIDRFMKDIMDDKV